MNKKLAYVLYVLLGIVSAAFLVMTILASAGVDSVWVGMPVMIVLFVLAIALLISIVAFNPKKSFYSFGFYFLHIGIVLFLVGSLVYAVTGVKTNAAPPVVNSFTKTVEYRMKQMGVTDAELANMKGYYNQLRRTTATGESEIVDLGFNFRIVDFKTEYYDAEQKNVKHYEATLEYYENGVTKREALTVNHPIRKNGYKIYLMDVGENQPFGYTEVQLLFKKDPTEFLSTSGIILTVLGTFMMCLLRPGEAMLKKKKKKEQSKKKKGGAKA